MWLSRFFSLSFCWDPDFFSIRWRTINGSNPYTKAENKLQMPIQVKKQQYFLTSANKRIYLPRLQNRSVLTRSAPPHWLRPPPHPAPLGRGAVALHIVPPVQVMLYALKCAAIGSAAAQTERAAAAPAAISGDSDVESSLALAVVKMKGSRRPFLVHERLGFIHWQRASLA